MDCSLPGSSIHGIFQARVLEWGAIALSYSSFLPALYFTHGSAYMSMLVFQFIPTSPSVVLFFTFWSLVDLESGKGNGTLLQYSCLENPMDGGAWWAAVHGVAKSDTTE